MRISGFSSNILKAFQNIKMENKIPETITRITDQKPMQNPEVQKLLDELNSKVNAGVSLRECETLLSKAKRLSEKLNDSTILEILVIDMAKELVRIGSDKEAGRSVRIGSLENSLQILFNFYGKQQKSETIGGLKPAVLLLIARACYERSLLILTRHDKVMLEKKKSILMKGNKFAGEVISHDDSNKMALRLRCLLLLELEKIDKMAVAVSDLKKALSSAIQKRCTEFGKHADDIEIVLKYAEMCEVDKPLLEGIVKTTLSEDNAKDIELKKAKAHFLLGNDFAVITCMETFAEQLVSSELPFSNCAWTDGAGFVKRLKDENKECWREISLQLWEATQKRYKESISLEHYWYFGHLMAHFYLSDLAFIAAKEMCNTEKMVEIADSLKSKILLHGQSLDDEVARFWEYNKNAREKRFIKGLKMAYETEKKRTSGTQRRKFTEIPKGWVVIHFYLNKLEKKGYAILAYPDKAWEIKEFPYGAGCKITRQTMGILQKNGVPNDIEKGMEALVDKWYANEEELIHDLEAKIGAANTARYKKVILQNILPVNLFQKFQNFQMNYNVNHPTKMPKYRINAAYYLVELCKEIGNVMPFLFDIPLKKHILFVPGDFLSRCPLHGALDNNDNIFLQNHESCSYLPAWSLAHKNEAEGQKDSEEQIEKRLLKCFEDHGYDELKKAVKWDSQEDPATPGHLLNRHISQGILTILSHGKADAVNSLNAKLILNGGDVTNFDIMKHPSLRLDRCHVILGCCEGDLLPPLSGALDEHLSIASAFVFKGADVLCTTWEVDPDEQLEEVIKFIIEQYNSKNNLSQAINDWQKEELLDWKNLRNSKRIYNTIVFRFMGGL